MNTTAPPETAPGTWRELLGARFGPVSAVLAGVLVTLGGDSLLTSTRLLFAVFGVVALLGTLAAVRAARVPGTLER